MPRAPTVCCRQSWGLDPTVVRARVFCVQHSYPSQHGPLSAEGPQQILIYSMIQMNICHLYPGAVLCHVPSCVHPGSGSKKERGRSLWERLGTSTHLPCPAGSRAASSNPPRPHLRGCQDLEWELGSQAGWPYPRYFIDVAIHKSIGVWPLWVRPREAEGVDQGHTACEWPGRNTSWTRI